MFFHYMQHHGGFSIFLEDCRPHLKSIVDESSFHIYSIDRLDRTSD